MLHSATADATRKCVACREHKPCNEFSNRSLKRACANNELLLCKLCVQPSSTAGMSVEEAKQVVQAHQTKISKYRATNGQVTGKKHYPQKGNGAESAPRLSKKIKEVAKAATADFVDTFDIKSITFDELENVMLKLASASAKEGSDQANGLPTEDPKPDCIVVTKTKAHARQLRAALDKMPKYKARAFKWWADDEQLTDFGSTLRAPGLREKFTVKPGGDNDGLFATGMLHDAKFMTNTRELHFSSKAAEPADQVDSFFSISSIPSEFIIRDNEGTLLVGGEQGTIPVAGRAARQISAETHDDFVRLFRRLDDVRDECRRGGSCASIKQKFKVLGYRLCERTQQGIPHTGNIVRTITLTRTGTLTITLTLTCR